MTKIKLKHQRLVLLELPCYIILSDHDYYSFYLNTIFLVVNGHKSDAFSFKFLIMWLMKK